MGADNNKDGARSKVAVQFLKYYEAVEYAYTTLLKEHNCPH